MGEVPGACVWGEQGLESAVGVTGGAGWTGEELYAEEHNGERDSEDISMTTIWPGRRERRAERMRTS